MKNKDELPKIIKGELVEYQDSKTNIKIPSGKCIPAHYKAGTILEYPSGSRYVVSETGSFKRIK